MTPRASGTLTIGVLVLVTSFAVGGCTSRTDTTALMGPSSSSAHPTDAAGQEQLGVAGSDSSVKSDIDGGDRFAVDAMTAFVDRALPYEAWWAELSPYLSPAALVAYEYTDPANVPASAVTGDPIVAAAPDGTVMSVLVPTDQGQYRVELERQSDDAEWTVDRFTPPDGLS